MHPITIGLFLLLIVSVLLANKVIAIAAIAAIYFQDKLLPHVAPAAAVDEVKYDPCELCGPADPFNTYDGTEFARDVDREFAEYKAMVEYPREMADEIPQVFTKADLQTADDYCARAQRYTQKKADEAIINRARLNANTFRPYFAEEMESAENASWWNVDQIIHFQ